MYIHTSSEVECNHHSYYCHLHANRFQVGNFSLYPRVLTGWVTAVTWSCFWAPVTAYYQMDCSYT